MTYKYISIKDNVELLEYLEYKWEESGHAKITFKNYSTTPDIKNIVHTSWNHFFTILEDGINIQLQTLIDKENK